MPKQAIKHAITDAQIAGFMCDGSMEIADALTEPRLIFRGREITAELNKQGGRRYAEGSDRYRFTIWYGGKRRRIMRSRIVWLWYFNAIPDNHDVHHGDAGRYVDGLANIECWSEDDHANFHYGSNKEF